MNINKTVLVYSDRLMKECKKSGIISFKEDVWYFYDAKSHRKRKMDFSSFGEYKDKVKAWVYARIYVNTSYAAVQEGLALLRLIYRDTRAFTNVTTETILGNIEDAYHTRAACFKTFSMFIQEFTIEAESVASYIKTDRKMRGLAECYSFVYTDQLINDFCSNITDEDFKMYGPVIIWWNFCSVIPMRPNELCLIKKDCLSVANGMHYIAIPTIKQRYDRDPEYSLMAISKKLYDLIDRYLTLVAYDPRTYIFSEMELRKLTGAPRISVSEVSTESLRKILNVFYTEIVEKRFGETVVSKTCYMPGTLQRFQLGDLRPFAIFNLMMQGLDPYAIKKMARHTHMSTQTQYYNNLSNYAMGRVHAMSKRIMIRKSESLYNSVSSTLSKKELIARQAMNQGGLKIKNGECSNRLNCPPEVDCPYCQFYIPYDPHECKVEYDKEKKALEACVESMKAVYKKRGGRYEALQSLSMELNTRVNRMALLEARRETKKV